MSEAPKRKDMADWSGLPDVYVTSVNLIDGVAWEITACSVPMAIGPEVRLVRADLFAAANARIAELEAQLARVEGDGTQGYRLERIAEGIERSAE